MIIQAKFKSVCPCCGNQISVGENVEWKKGSKAIHEACNKSIAPINKVTNPSIPKLGIVYFVLRYDKAVSKHNSLETANKKVLTLRKQDRLGNKAHQTIQKIFTIANYQAVEVEKGSKEYIEYMEHLTARKEEKLKHNAKYAKEHPEEYKAYLIKRGIK